MLCQIFKYWSSHSFVSGEISLQMGVEQALETVCVFREDLNHIVSYMV